jgi:pilus assembly protein CpaF
VNDDPHDEQSPAIPSSNRSSPPGGGDCAGCGSSARASRRRPCDVLCGCDLNIRLPDVVAMQTPQANLEGTGEIELRRLVKEALRMRPERIIVGEVREEGCLGLLIALTIGWPVM